MTDSPGSAVFLLAACVILSLTSRRWRSSTLPWGMVALFTAVASGADPWLSAGLATVVVVLETIGRAAALADVLPVVLVAAAFMRWSPGALSQVVVRLLVLTALALVLGLGLRFATRLRTGAWGVGAWTEVATALLLLASSSLLASGLARDLPLLAILGVFTPALLPALLEEATGVAAARGRVDGLVAGAGSFASALSAAGTARPEALAEILHAAFEPYLRHAATVVALTPTYAGGSTVVLGCHPDAGPLLPRIREKARHMLLSGRRDSLVGVRVTTLADRDHLHPAHPHQILVPLRRGRELVALLAVAGPRPLIPPGREPDFAEAAASVLDRVLERRDLEERVEHLTQRSRDQGERLRQLLRLGQHLGATQDPKQVTENLTRTVCDVFGFGRCELLLGSSEDDTARRVAVWGNGHCGWLGTTGGEISSSTLAAALSLGTPMSRGVVVPVDSWPSLEAVPPDVRHLLVLGLGADERNIGYLVAVPRVETEIPDPNDLRVLEILVEQVTPALASTLQVEELHRQALVDDLTGVSNRRGLDHHLNRIAAEISERGEGLAFAMIDADDFKSVNDRYGHRIGDVVLRELADLLAMRVRALDFVARYGGEEFSVVLPGLGRAQAVAVLERLRTSIAEHEFARAELSHPLSLTVSIGVAVFPDDVDAVHGLIERADAALYAAKARGKNRVVRAGATVPGSPEPADEPFPL